MARFRLADESSFRLSENEAHSAQRTELRGVEHRTALGDLQRVALPPERVSVVADVFARIAAAAHPIDDEIRCNHDGVAVGCGDAHVAYHAARPRGRIFRVAIGGLEA